MASRIMHPGEVRHHGHKLDDEQIAALMAEAIGWRPADGDELRGTVLGTKIASTDINGTPRDYPLVVVLMDEGKEIPDENGVAHDVIGIHCFHASLVGEMKAKRPQRGDRIYVKRIGEKGEAKRKGWNAPIVFAVAVTKPDGKQTDVWDTFANQSSPPSPAQAEFDDEPPF